LLGLLGMIFIPTGLHFSQSGAHFVWESMFSYFKDAIAGANVQMNSSSATMHQSLNGITIGFGSFLTDFISGIVLLISSKKLLAHKTSIQ
jgi:hypothetical protein